MDLIVAKIKEGKFELTCSKSVVVGEEEIVSLTYTSSCDVTEVEVELGDEITQHQEEEFHSAVCITAHHAGKCMISVHAIVGKIKVGLATYHIECVDKSMHFSYIFVPKMKERMRRINNFLSTPYGILSFSV